MIIGHACYIYSPKRSIMINDNAAEMQFCITNCTCDEAGFNSTLALALAHLSSLKGMIQRRVWGLQYIGSP